MKGWNLGEVFGVMGAFLLFVMVRWFAGPRPKLHSDASNKKNRTGDMWEKTERSLRGFSLLLGKQPLQVTKIFDGEVADLFRSDLRSTLR